ncbi:hypothetical protein EV44_g4078 [Erysiphe necator]|uniref:Uncharacterized protein n=1 Tax=Uncinula necator TaxID=52586 RepID=A0A0B1PAG0_UNCNE|nr:hypothetical protein EV44_g4078 [Erysiphe necator]
MALPTRDKRRGVSETLDAKRRVQKSINNAGRAQPRAATLTRLAVASPLKQTLDPLMDIDDEPDESEKEPEIDEFLPLTSKPPLKRNADIFSSSDQTQDISLVNLVGPYLEEMELESPGAGSDFLALISDRVSRAVRGKIFFLKVDDPVDPQTTSARNNSWASKTAMKNIRSSNIPIRAPLTRPTPPQGQSHEDRRIIIRLGKDHKSRKTEPFLLRQKIQKLLRNPSFVCDAWQAPSGIAILAPTPAKVAAILQYKDVIAQRFGNAIVERQESWATFIVGPLSKLVTTIDGTEDPVDGLLLQELDFVSIRDDMPIEQVAWTNRSKESMDDNRFIRIHVPQHKAHKFLIRM